MLISCDPGLHGAIVFWESIDKFFIRDMPNIKIKSKTIVDYDKVARWFLCHNPSTVVIEQVGASPRGGAASMFGFGQSFGILLGAAAGCGAEVVTVTPQIWKTFHGLLKKEKDAARVLAIQKFPQYEDTFKLKKHCDRADAALIGDYYIRRKK